MQKYTLKITLAALFAVAATSASAAVVNVTRGAVAMTSNLNTLNGYQQDNLIDQVGLNNPYVNGVTAFETFTSTARHSLTGTTSFAANWLGNKQQTLATPALNFDLGANYDIDGFAFFNLPTLAQARVGAINVYSDNDNNASNGYGTSVFSSGSFGNAADSVGSNVAPNVFSFSNLVNTRYLVFELTGAVPSWTLSIGAGEVVFSQAISTTSAVPEPTPFAMLALGLLTLGIVHGASRRRV